LSSQRLSGGRVSRRLTGCTPCHPPVGGGCGCGYSRKRRWPVSASSVSVLVFSGPRSPGRAGPTPSTCCATMSRMSRVLETLVCCGVTDRRRARVRLEASVNGTKIRQRDAAPLCNRLRKRSRHYPRKAAKLGSLGPPPAVVGSFKDFTSGLPTPFTNTHNCLRARLSPRPVHRHLMTVSSFPSCFSRNWKGTPVFPVVFHGCRAAHSGCISFVSLIPTDGIPLTPFKKKK